MQTHPGWTEDCTVQGEDEVNGRKNHQSVTQSKGLTATDQEVGKPTAL